MTKSEHLSQNQSNMDSSGNVQALLQPPVSDRDAKNFSEIMANHHDGDSSQFQIDEKQKFGSFQEDSFEPVSTGEEEQKQKLQSTAPPQISQLNDEDDEVLDELQALDEFEVPDDDIEHETHLTESQRDILKKSTLV